MGDELEVAIFVDALREFEPCGSERTLLSPREVAGPFFPASKVEVILERAVQGIVVKPVGIFLDEVIECAPLADARSRCERLERALLQLLLEGDIFFARNPPCGLAGTLARATHRHPAETADFGG